MAILITTDGSETDAQPKNPRKGFQLEELYELIGGGCDMVERVDLADRREMWLDEEGKYRGTQKPNAKATALLAISGGIPGDIVMGNVVITKRGEVK